MRHGMVLIALSCAPALALAQAPAARPSEASGGIVITGDREAPLVLHIVPWQEPTPVHPPTLALQPLLPEVVDNPRSVVDDPLNRPPGQAPEPKR